MRKLPLLLLPLLLLLASSLSWAEEPSAESPRDPKGIKGISPYQEHLATGRKAFAKRDYPAAITAFKRALQTDSTKMLPYLLLAQTMLDSDQLGDAMKFLEEGRSKSAQPDVQAKAIFLHAMVLERKANHDAAKPKDGGLSSVLVTAWEATREAWSAYSVFLTAHSTLPDHKASAADRKKKIDERQKRDKDYGAVRARAAEKAKQRAKEKK